jgi:SAM-dependent methyltransferase
MSPLLGTKADVQSGPKPKPYEWQRCSDCHWRAGPDTQAGDEYVSYADGNPSQPFGFDGLHAYADRCVWAALETKLADLRATGASSVRFLDAGCGPGTWLRRLVLRARALGFRNITARGFDIAQARLRLA